MKIGPLFAGLMLCVLAAFAYAMDTEDGFWQSVLKANAQEEYELYLKQYPHGRHVQEARRILEAMGAREREKDRAEDKARAQQQKQAEAQQRARAESRRKEKEEAQRKQTEAEAERQRAEEDARRQAQEASRRRAEAEAMRPGRVFRDCADCPEMAVVPAGSFEMGSNNGDSDEKPVHTVHIDRSFALAKTEVTQAQWRAVMGGNPSRFGGCDDCPVESVNWYDAQDFARTLSRKTGRTYRLPSEAEWEYACRAGGRQEYCGGDDVGAVAWFWSNSGGKARPVGSKQANGWGLHDMSGNVWEWVEDCWNASYNGAPPYSGAWRRGNCGARVLRGGSWGNVPGIVRAAKRLGVDASVRGDDYGFRPAGMLP